MPSTDIDGSPILILSVEDARRLRLIVMGCRDCMTQRERDGIKAKINKFWDDPQVVTWMEAHEK